MTGANTGSEERSSTTWPTLDDGAAVVRADAGLAHVETGTAKLLDLIGGLSATALKSPSRLPDWRRSHLVSHLARNADALVNLLTWAHTGVEHPMYTSRADRDADIEEGAKRPAQLLIEDLRASCGRFTAAAAGLSESDWRTEVVGSRDRALPGHEVPWLRVQEVWIHLVDLDVGVEITDLPAEVVEAVLEKVIWTLADRPDVPPLDITADLPTGRRNWRLNADGPDAPAQVNGSGADVLAWLTGRGDGTGITGDLPELPAWL